MNTNILEQKNKKMNISLETRKKLSDSLKKAYREGRKISNGMLGKKHSQNTILKMRKSRLKLKEKQGYLNSVETRKKISESHMGQKAWNKGKKGRFKNQNIDGLKIGRGWNKDKKLGFIPKCAFKKGENFGDKNHAWKGGITPINKKIRDSIEYKLWRTAVFKRDNYTCVWCGDNTGGNLNADHIKPFAYYPELRFVIDNGRTLCVKCHKTTYNYLWKGKKHGDLK